MNAVNSVQTSSVTSVKSVELEQFLVFSHALISKHGYTSNSEARTKGTMSTGELAWIWMNQGRANDVLKNTPLEAIDRVIGKKVFEWMKEIIKNPANQKSDYMMVLARIGVLAQVTEREVGYAASAVTSWLRDNTPANKGAHLGKVGERLKIEVTVKGFTAYASRFAPGGEGYIHSFEDGAGNPIKWFTDKVQGDLNISDGDKILLEGTVKKHDDYRGTKQTIVNRCKVTKR